MKLYNKPYIKVRIFNNKRSIMVTDESNVNPGNLSKVKDYNKIKNKLDID